MAAKEQLFPRQPGGGWLGAAVLLAALTTNTGIAQVVTLRPADVRPDHDPGPGWRRDGAQNYDVVQEVAIDLPDRLGLFSLQLPIGHSLGRKEATFSLATGPHSGPPGSAARQADRRWERLEALYGHVFGARYDPLALSPAQQNAFQFAVWATVLDLPWGQLGRETEFGPSADRRRIGQAVLWLAWVDLNAASAPRMSLAYLHHPTHPDLLLPEMLYVTSIPEPELAVLLLAAAVAAAHLRTRARPNRITPHT